MTPRRVIVAGGGISGLAAAFTLQQEAQRRQLPLTVTLLEAAPEAGGHARTIAEEGWVVERGPNGFLSSGEETLALIDDLQLRPRLVEANAASKRRFILKNGALRQVPMSPMSLLTTDALGWRGKLRMFGEPWAAAPPAGTDESVFDFAERRLGREAAETLVDTAVSGISAGDSKALSLRSQFPTLKAWETAHGSLLKAMFRQPKRQGGSTRLLSFDRGLGTFTGALAQRLNGAVRVNTPVERLANGDSGWTVHARSGESFDADRIIFATPSHAAAAIAATWDRQVSESMAQIPYAPIVVVALGYDVSAIGRALDGYGYLVGREEHLATLGVLWESCIFPGRAPAGSVLLRIMLGGARRPDIAALRDDAVATLAAREAAKVLGISGAPLRQWVCRWPSAIAQYTIGHDARVAQVRERVQAHRGLHVCGTAYDGVSFNDAIASARRTARSIIEELAA